MKQEMTKLLTKSEVLSYDDIQIYLYIKNLGPGTLTYTVNGVDNELVSGGLYQGDVEFQEIALVPTTDTTVEVKCYTTDMDAENIKLASQLENKTNIGALSQLPALGNSTQISQSAFIGMDKSQRIYRTKNSKTLERSDDNLTWEDIYTFQTTPVGVRQLDNGELLVGLAHDYPTNTVKATVWLSSGYDTNNTTWSQVIEADDYQQNFKLAWGFGGGDGNYVVSEYDSKAVGSRSINQKAWLTQDFGLTWTEIYDHGSVSGKRHIHGATYDIYRDAIWLSVGDYDGIDIDARAILVSWDLGANWTTVTNTHQPTAIHVFKDCVIFGTDNAPNGILAIIDPSENNLIVEVVYKLNSENSISHVAEAPFMLGDSHPLLMPYTTSGSGKGVVIATYDGITWFKIWEDENIYADKGVSRAIGPTKNGNYLICGENDSGYFVTEVDDLNNDLISTISRLGKTLYYNTPKRSYIAMANKSDPYTIIPSGVETTVLLDTTPYKLFDVSELFLVSPDGTGVSVKRDCIATVSADSLAYYNSVNPNGRLMVNGNAVASSSFETMVTKTIYLNAGDKVSVEAYHSSGVDKTVKGSAYCLTIDVIEYF